ncbi:hypothetical protein PVAND_012002 [Polypedilum vanderplanki]|uniref:Smoothelin domain-containing protein n=1 Tax=Polypedilum vanderplanki TaxID=319348 RepID=A0A9J6CLD6_POLVA|nr:hypothetical protein PVAND_012002 [Polypedilum vanderplanki]
MASDLSGIKDEDLLRKMWQETEDFGLKKEIRAHMYKLREARLREFYVNEMDSKNQQFDTKTPITSRHGAMADHSFESLKSNEIHGTDMSEIKFGDTGGWNVITSSEYSDDGKARTDKMMATTEGVQALKGGEKRFSGKNEELKTERYDGDAKNFTYTTGEQSNMVLNENIVTGDDSNRRVEKKSSSVSHSSKVIRSSGGGIGTDEHQQIMQDNQDSRRSSVSTVKSSSHHTESKNVTQSNAENVKLSTDSAVVQEAMRLAQQPGTILSRQVERTNDNTNMITERKELHDGTIVTTRRYEPISSSHIDIQATTTSSSGLNQQQKQTTTNTESVNKTQETFKTSRDEEAFRLSQQPGNIISRDVTMKDANTRMITEKKELHDGTIVTTKRYENISNDNSSDQQKFSSTSKTTSTTTNQQQYKTARDEEAFRLAQQPGKIISRDVSMANPTTRMIVEKKELNDGTIVTTKRYESVDSSTNDTKSVKSFTKEQQSDDFAKSLRSDSHTTKSTTTETNYRTSRDEEAFRLAQQPGKIISRDVSMANPTTRMIVEKKELNDGTIVTTKRYENINENVDVQKISKNVDLQSSNVRKTTENVDNHEQLKKFTTNQQNTNDNATQREVIEETVTKKIIDTSCKCPSMDKHDHKTREFIQNERTNDKYDVTSEIITNEQLNNKRVLTEIEKQRIEETNRREEMRKLEQKRVETEQQRKITRELEVDSAHKAFASSLRCVTPPLEKQKPIPRDHDRRSPSRDTTTSKFSSSTMTIKKNSNVDVRRNEDFMRPTQASGLRTTSKSPEKQTQNVKKTTKASSTEIIEYVIDDTVKNRSSSPQKIVTPKKSKDAEKPREISPVKSSPSTPRSVSPQKSSSSTPRETSPTKQASYPQKLSTLPRDSSPQKSTTTLPRDKTSPQKQTSTLPRESSPTKTTKKPEISSNLPRESSPLKSSPSTPRSVSPQKSSTSTPRETSPIKSKPTSRDISPQKQQPTASATFPRTQKNNETPRSTPDKTATFPRSSSPFTPRESSPIKSSSSTPRAMSPQKNITPERSTKKNILDEEEETNELITTTLKIDNIDKTINDLKIIQTIDSKNMSATTSVSDLEYISASDHKKLITDLDSEDIQVKIDIENANQLDDLQIKTTVSEVVDEKTTIDKKKKPFNRSETFEERAKKLIGVKSDDETCKEVPSYLKPTKASSAPDKTRVSEIRERKAKIEELERTTLTTKKNSLTSATNEFIINEKTASTKTPLTQKKESSESKRTIDNRSSDIEDTKETKKTTNIIINRTSKSPEKKKTDEKITKTSRTTETTEERLSRSTIRPETHITVAQITISPSRGITSKTVTNTTTVQSNKNLKMAPSIKLVKQSTDVSSTEPDTDTDHELIKNINKTGSKTIRKKLVQNRKDSAPVTKTTSTGEKDKVSRSVSEKIIKIDKKGSITRDIKESSKKETKRPTKCITTKTINLTNINGHDSTLISNKLDNVEIDITVQQAKSSREPSPDKIIPIPVHTDDEINEENTLHPNKITEPDDTRKSKPKVINVPIFQEQTKQFVGLEITEIGTEKGQTIIEEEEIEESERIINSSTLEKADRKRNSIQIDPLDENEEQEQEHAHLLSVSQKVNKFNEAVGELKKSKPSTQFRPEDEFKIEDVPDDVDDDNSRLSVTQKVSKFSKATDDTKITSFRHQSEEHMTRSIDEVDENLKDDDCLLSVSDKVNKFISTSEKIASTDPQKSPELVKNIMKQTSKNVKDKIDNITDQFITNEKISSTTKTSDITLRSTEAIKKAREVFEKNSSKSTATRDIQRHNDILSRPSVFESKRTPTVERKTYKENVTTTTHRSSHEKSPERQDHHEIKASSPRRGSNDRTPVYMKDQVSTKKDLFEKRISSSKLESENYHHKSLSPQNSVEEKRHSISDESSSHQQTRRVSCDKHYMQHTVASLEHVAKSSIREAEIQRTSRPEDLEHRRESLKSPTTKLSSEPREESPRSPTKFGVELKRTDSYKMQAQTNARKVSTGSETINIEEIFDLEELERLLEIVVGYEQRRKIRTQIRIVKKKIEDQKMKNDVRSRMTTTKTTTRTEPMMQKKIVEKSKTPRDDAHFQTVTTTTTTTTRMTSGDKEPRVTKTSKVTTTPASPRTIIDTINKSNKGKTTESVVKTVKKTSATSNTSQKKSSNTMRESKTETDCITSSYGVGPTDSNGLPLFGLKALKKKPQGSTVESKTTGTIISEVSYSENGGPAVVQRKTTKYSSDPSDFTNETDLRSSKAITERKNSRGGIYSVTKVEKLESDSKKPKVIRNGSVKEIKEKFVRKDSSSKMSTKRSSIDRDSESSHNVSKSSKMTSSETKTFLNSERKASNVKEVVTMMKNSDNVYEEGDTQEDAEARALLNKFLGATALMTSIEKNSGLSKEFLSSGGAKNKNTSSASKVTTTKTVTSYSSGSEKFQDINDIWDIDLLKKLLEATTNYDERREIRDRIRQIMADQEACADFIQQVSADLDADNSTTTTGKNESNSSINQTEEGESLLLPLLTGILQNPKYRNLSARQILSLNLSRAIAQKSMPQNSASKMNSEHNNNLIDGNNGCLGNDFPIEDSGTESGEDLRLLAASLSNHMDESKLNLNEQPQGDESASIEDKQKADSLGNDLLTEVTTALERLQNSLNLGEIDLDDGKKATLLSLVNRLQSGLVSNEKKIEHVPERNVNESPRLEKLSDERRGSSGGNVNRFNKRKNRANRHTVGVTREELADARRIIEEIEFIGIQNAAAAQATIQPKVTAKVFNSTPGIYNAILTRQISEPITLLRPSQFVPKETQVEIQGKPKYKLLFKQSISLDQPTSILKNTVKQEVFPKKETVTHNSSENSTTSNNLNFKNDALSDDSSSSDDEDEMINTKFYNGNNTPIKEMPNGKFKAKENYLRNQEKQNALEKLLNYSSGDEGNLSNNSNAHSNKYTSKKMKMKRANTIDLPKSFSFVNTFELSERDYEDGETLQNTYQNRNSAGLKTTFTAGSTPMPPKFTPKTENDKKFMAFIEKQNSHIMPSYVNPSAPRNEPRQQNWTNKFGNLKTKFEDGPKEQPKIVPKTSNAAANFWKNIEKDKPSAKVSPLPAVPIKTAQTFIKNLPTSTEKFPWKNSEKQMKIEEPVTPKKKQFVDKFIPKEQPETVVHKTIIEPNKLPALPKPANVNNFSHAPLSVFKPPISRKLSNSFKPIQTNEEIVKKQPMPQIANGIVKQMAETGYSINNPIPAPRKIANSPTRSLASLDSSFVKVQKTLEPKSEPAPWATQPKSERVLSLAASKFENVPTVHLAPHLESDPVVRFRNNPLYNGTFEKRSSLPLNATYASFEAPAFKEPKKEVTSPKSKETTFVITDYTQPTSISTYAPEIPTLARQDSLTNPTKEPLVLTCDRTVISPRENIVKPIETPPYPISPQISNNNSIGSICDDLERELDDLGESIECQAAVSKVMKAPIAQTAYTQSSELTSLNEQSKENSMMKSLQDSLKKVQQKSPTPPEKNTKRLSQDSSNSSIELKLQSLKMPPLKTETFDSQSRLSQDSSNSSLEIKLPPLKIPIPAVPETAYSITYKSPPRIQVKSPSTDPPPPLAHVMYNNVSPNNLVKGRTLSIPKPTIERSITPPGMYGIPQNIIDAKQKTVASFFMPTANRTESLRIKPAPLSIVSSQPARKISLQVKPMTRVSAVNHRAQSMNSLSRSKTMPSLANVELLDESNIDDAFEELLSSSNL